MVQRDTGDEKFFSLKNFDYYFKTSGILNFKSFIIINHLNNFANLNTCRKIRIASNLILKDLKNDWNSWKFF